MAPLVAEQKIGALHAKLMWRVPRQANFAGYFDGGISTVSIT